MASISVIVPIYKVEKYLNKCIDSLTNQTFKDIEIILVDDGSPDSCGKLCDSLAERDDRIKVIHKVNGGLSDARNAGIEIAKGKYIGFVDSDDYVENDMFMYLYNLCEQNNADMSACNLIYEFEETGEHLTREKDCYSVMQSQQFFLKMIDTQGYLRMGVWNKLYRRELFDNVRFPKGKLYEDVGTMFKVVFQAKKIVYGEVSKYYYLKRKGAITSGSYTEREYDRYEMTNDMVEYIKKNQPAILPQAIAYKDVSCVLSIANKMIDANKYDKAFLRMLKNDVLEYFWLMTKSSISIIKKIQITIFMISFPAYRYIYKLLRDN